MTSIENVKKEKGSNKDVTFYKPPNVLKEKVGDGGISPTVLDRGEQFIDNNDLDFMPYAKDIMDRLNALIKDAKAGKITGKDAINQMVKPIMELKANGGMFRYRMVSEIANIVLDFLENVDELNEDCFEIIDAHQTTLAVIVGNKLEGDGGPEGRRLAKELYGATTRFYKKYKIKR